VNKVEAIRWYNKASDNGIVQAKYNLAMYFKNGESFSSDSGVIVLNSDKERAIKILQECSRFSFAPADRELAKIYLDEKDSLHNKDIGMKFLILAVQGDDPEAVYMLAKLRMKNGVSVKEVFPCIKLAAENNVVDAFEYAGVCYETGTGTKQDKDLAIKYYLKAAQNNVLSAQVRLGEYYLNGTIVEMNIWESAYWFGKAADQDDPYALFMMGSFAEQGLGEKADWKKALKYYMKSAKLGFPKAQYNLALYYSGGNNGEKEEDANMAYLWLRKAALQDDSRAQKELGFYCIMGEGTKQNYSYGLNWLALSSEKGDPEAAEFLNGIQVK
jgi:TPR repeat protein